MSDSIVFATNFNANKLTISDVRTNPTTKAKQAYINYNGGKFIVQTPHHMNLPFGLGVQDKSKFGGTGFEYSLDLSLNGYNDDSSPVGQYFEMLQSLDEFIIKTAVSKSEEWFGKKKSEEVIRDMFKSAVKMPRDESKGYAPTQKIKLRKNQSGEFETKFYNPKGKLYTNTPIEDLLPKRAQVTVLLQCAGLWFTAAGFGVTWRAQQVVIHKLPEKMKEFAFVGTFEEEAADEEDAPVRGGGAGGDDDGPAQINDDDILGAVMPKAVAKTAAAPPPPAPVEDESDHEAEDHEPIPAPAPVKTVVKKVVKKVVKA
jgi:hypothetical protein